MLGLPAARPAAQARPRAARTRRRCSRCFLGDGFLSAISHHARHSCPHRNGPPDLSAERMRGRVKPPRADKLACPEIFRGGLSRRAGEPKMKSSLSSCLGGGAVVCSMRSKTAGDKNSPASGLRRLAQERSVSPSALRMGFENPAGERSAVCHPRGSGGRGEDALQGLQTMKKTSPSSTS